MAPDFDYLAYIARCNEHRFDDLAEFVADAVTVNGEAIDRARYGESLLDFTDAFPDHHWEVRDLVVCDDRVAAVLENTGTQDGPYLGVAPTGRRVVTHEVVVYRLVDGRIAEVWGTADHSRVLRQLRDEGLAP